MSVKRMRFNRKPAPGELKPTELTDVPFSYISMDFITNLPEVKSAGHVFAVEGYNTFDQCLVVQCCISRKVLLLPGHSTYDAATWATVLVRALRLCDWGLPRKIVSDRDPKFTSDLWQQLFKRYGTRLAMSTAYHPQTDGTTERRIQTVEVHLRIFLTRRFSEDDFDIDMTWAEFSVSLQHQLNCACTQVLGGKSPDEVVMGMQPRRPEQLLSPIERISEAARLIYRQVNMEDAIFVTDLTNTLAKERYDSKHVQLDLKKGDKVMVALGKGYQLPGRDGTKWELRRTGPFSIKRRINDGAYEINFPKEWNVHPVVSIAQLYPVENGPDPFSRRVAPPDPVIVKGEVRYIVDYIIRHHLYRNQLQFRVKWDGYNDEADETWEKFVDMLEDEATASIKLYLTRKKLSLRGLLGQSDIRKKGAEIDKLLIELGETTLADA